MKENANNVYHVFICRHGQTKMNKEKKWSGSTNVGLNETGQEQAKELAKKIAPLGVQRIYSSALLRARQTAEIIKKFCGDLPETVCYNLRECDFGECEGLVFEKATQKYGERFVQDFLYPTQETWDNRFVGGESKHDVFNRVIKCLQWIVSKDEHCVVVVCHAGVLSAAQCGLGLNPNDVSYDNGAILHLSYDKATEKWTQIKDQKKAVYV